MEGESRYSSAAFVRQAMEGRQERVVTGQRVLVVNGIPETEAVLKAVFETRGHRVQRVRSNNQQGSVPLAERPSVVVLDADETNGEPDRLWSEVPRIILGDRVAAAGRFSSGEGALFLEKPFQYPELVRAIEQLLESGGADPNSRGSDRPRAA